nr:hypothetical protein [Tanacetum cinerariifolium]
LKKELATIQSAMVSNPFSSDLREAKLSCLKAYKEALMDEELFLRQKPKIEWLSEGDCNSKYFHNVVKGRINRGRISVVEDMNGVPHFGVSVGEQFVNHFQSVLGKCSKVLLISNPEFLFTNKFSEGDAAYMIRDISDDEFKAALFDIDSNKAPGPDGKLLKEVNATVISLVPKISTPRRVSDFRPIACCNVVYKCISKIMVNRIKGCLNSLVDQNQSAFIPSSKSVAILKKSLDEFGSVSGLFPSFPKSTVFFGNVKEISKNKILKVMPFIEGKLPVRHAFMVWLAIHGRLRTQDLMVKWEKYGDMRCVFCKNVLDNHDHLFFECEFSKKV